MNNNNSTRRVVNVGPVLRLLGLDSSPPGHTVVIIIVHIIGYTQGNLAALPDHNLRTHEVVVRDNLAALPDHNLRTHEVVVRDNIGANRALLPSNTCAVIVLDGLGDIMISTIIYTIHTGFREPRIVPAVHTCDWCCAFEAYVLGLIGGILVGTILYLLYINWAGIGEDVSCGPRTADYVSLSMNGLRRLVFLVAAFVNTKRFTLAALCRGRLLGDLHQADLAKVEVWESRVKRMTVS
ncbi:hypothetical protein K438DRAFT_2135535 [Mycena galopus ATCC 62051]|nr:hypothetical protein K438DRAFT_2135535 [Mycena galopus ATCC 62051]